jgi:NADH-quinone oxidoreductase subunit N
METIESLSHFLPELILTGTLALVIVFEFVMKRNKARVAAWLVGIGAAIAAVAALGDAARDPVLIFYGSTAVDPFVVFFRFFLSAVAVTVVVFTIPHAADDGVIGRRGGEFYSLLLATLIGSYLLVGAANIVMIAIALELVSIPSYVMAGYFKDNSRGSEASVKYVIYGAFASGAMLYGLSLLYGMTGETSIYEIGSALRTIEPNLGLLAAAVLTLAGAGYKISMVPFHFWAPDVYEGAPTPAAAFFSVGPKVAGVALMVRLVWAFGAGPLSNSVETWVVAGGLSWTDILAAFAVITMTLGNLSALFQTNLKRLLAFSGIAHAGYILMGLAAFSGLGLRAVILYLMVYYLANLAFFLVVDMVEQKTGSVEIDEFRGLGWRNPMLGVALVIVLFSLTGLPPTAGFVGKLYLFSALISEKMYWLAIVGVFNSVISLWYYMRIARAMFLEDVGEESVAPLGTNLAQSVLLGALVVPVVIFGIFWGPLSDLARYAAGLYY